MPTAGPIFATQQDIVRSLPEIQTRFPRTPAELFLLLSYLTPERGLQGLMDRVDFRNVTPIDIYHTVFGRSPESVEIAVRGAEYDPRSAFSAALMSREFRGGVLPALLAAFPDKGRDVFIHVPKCAGTDLILNLAGRQLPLPNVLELDGWVSDAAFLNAIGGLARAIPFQERFFVYGHLELGHYVSRAGLRVADRVFSVIRDPFDQMLSQANYSIGRLSRDPTGKEADTAETLAYLGLPRLPEDIDAGGLKALAARALRDPRITQPNRACTYLGRRMQGTYRSAIENIVINNVELTDLKRYERWLRERWNISGSERHNRSGVILTRSEANRQFGGIIRPSMVEDQRLFDIVTWALDQTGGASVSGTEIARMAGDWLLDGLPVGLAAPASTSALKATSEPNLVVAEGADAVAMYLLPTPPEPDASTRADTLYSADFGAGGSGRDHLLDGWSVTEATFTWTDAEISQIVLPALPDGGSCLIRLVGAPLTSPSHPLQQIMISFNGEPVGTAHLTVISVIEFDIRAEWLRPGEPALLTFYNPTAARPRDIGRAAEDGRLLALALQRAMIVHIVPSDWPPHPPGCLT